MSGRSDELHPHEVCREKGIKKAASMSRRTVLERYTGAIAFFDLPGSTRMMKRNPRGAIQAMLQHNAMCGAVVKPNGGKIIKEIGDVIMVTFDSAGAAVECAIKVIRCLQEHGEGTHTKAVVASGILWRGKNSSGYRDVYGTPVHVSARMAEQADKDVVLVDGKDAEPVREWLEHVGFTMRITEKRLRDYKDRRLYAVSVK